MCMQHQIIPELNYGAIRKSSTQENEENFQIFPIMKVMKRENFVIQAERTREAENSVDK